MCVGCVLILTAAPAATAQEVVDTGTVTDTASNTAVDATGAVNHAAGTATDTADDTAGAVTDTVNDVTGTVEDTANGTTETVNGTVNDVNDSVNDTTNGLTNAVDDATDTVKNSTGDTTKGVTDTVDGTTGGSSGRKGGVIDHLVGGTVGGGSVRAPTLADLTPDLLDDLVDEAAGLGLTPVAAEGWIEGKTVVGAAAYKDADLVLGSMSSLLEDLAFTVAGSGSDGTDVVLSTGSSMLEDVGRAAVEAAKTLAFPLALIVVVVGFLAIQGRIGRKDPKLALAPVDTAEESLSFE